MLRKNEAKWIDSLQRWQINVQSDGERKTFVSSKKYSQPDNKKGKIEAEKKADKWLEGKENKDIRFEKLWHQFLESVKESNQFRDKSENYIKHETIGRLYILPNIRAKRVSKLTQNDYKECVMVAYKAGRSKRTCVNVRASLTAAYSFAASKRIPMERPNNIKIPKDAPVGKRNILQPEDLKKLFRDDTIIKNNKIIHSPYIHAWRFLVVTGLRRGEICGLEHSHISNGIVRIQQAYNRLNQKTNGKTENAQREFIITRHMQNILDDQKAMLANMGIESQWVFPDECGNRINPRSLFNHWDSYRKQHGMKSNLHELRHTFVSAVKADLPIPLLKRVVGHSANMDTIGIYGHDVDGELQRAADVIDSVFDRLLT